MGLAVAMAAKSEALRSHSSRAWQERRSAGSAAGRASCVYWWSTQLWWRSTVLLHHRDFCNPKWAGMGSISNKEGPEYGQPRWQVAVMEEQRENLQFGQFGLKYLNYDKMPCCLGKSCVGAWALGLSGHPPPSGHCNKLRAICQEKNLPPCC